MGVLASLAAEGRIHDSWIAPLTPVEARLEAVLERVRRADERALLEPPEPPPSVGLAGFDDLFGAPEAPAVTSLPAPENVLRAFTIPFDDVRVLILGQDPYPTPGNAIGFSFAVAKDVRPLPASLKNMFTELRDDLGIEPAAHGDLTAWTTQGVMLLNRVLTVAPRDAGSHRGWGWEAVTEQTIRALIARDQPLVAVLWGNDARALAPMFTGITPIESAHPSPLSARRGFFGSRPFSQVNNVLAAHHADPISWELPT